MTDSAHYDMEAVTGSEATRIIMARTGLKKVSSDMRQYFYKCVQKGGPHSEITYWKKLSVFEERVTETIEKLKAAKERGVPEGYLEFDPSTRSSEKAAWSWVWSILIWLPRSFESKVVVSIPTTQGNSMRWLRVYPECLGGINFVQMLTVVPRLAESYEPAT